MAPSLEVLLTGGERRMIVVPGSTSSIGNVLSRLDDWIETEDGGWIQKRFIVEVRLRDPERGEPMDEAERKLTDQASDESSRATT